MAENKKNSREREAAMANKGVWLAEKQEEARLLENELTRLQQTGAEVDNDVVEKFPFVFDEIEKAGRTTDEDKFKKIERKILNKIKEARAEVKRLEAAKKVVAEEAEAKTSEPPIVTEAEIEKETQAEIKELEPEASVDMELRTYENHYFDVKKMLEEFEGFIKKHNLEKGKDKSVQDFKSLLEELWNLVDKEKNYKKFDEDRAVFISALKESYAQAREEEKLNRVSQPPEEKQKEPSDEDLVKLRTSLGLEKQVAKKEKGAPVKTVETAVVKVEKESNDKIDDDQEKRNNLHARMAGKLSDLEQDIREKVKSKPSGYFAKNINALAEHLRNAKETARSGDFTSSANSAADFQKLFPSVYAEVGRAIAETNKTSKEKPVPTKEVEPVVENPVEAEVIVPDSKEVFEEVKPQPKKKKKQAKKELSPVIENLSEEKLPAVELKTSEKEPAVSGEIPDKGIVADKVVEPDNKVEVNSDYSQEVEVAAPVAQQVTDTKQEEPKKKGLWSRFKEAIFHPETKKVAKKVAYDTTTSILGIKFLTDAVRWAKSGEGDMAEWWKGKKERGSINEAYQTLMKAFEQNKNNKTDEQSEKILLHLTDLETKIKLADLSKDEKKALLDKLWLISMKHQEGSKSAVKDRNKAVEGALDIYVKEKVSTAKIVRDGLNTLLTGTGLSFLRGAAYLGASIAERAGKAKKEFAKQTLGEGERKAELGFVAKDVFWNSAVETARGLFGKGEQKDATGLRKAMDFVKAFGVVARGFGIYGLAISGTSVHEQAIDKLLSGVKENGAALTFSKNFLQNAEHVWHSYTHPTEMLGGRKEPQQQGIPSVQERSPVVEIPTTTVVQLEAPPAFSVDEFSHEHKLNSNFSRSLEKLVSEHKELNNEESLQKILKASQIGPDTHSQHDTILKGTIDTLDESGGERRQVIFEEILKNGGPKAAADYLQSQHFSSQHLSHLSGFIRKGTTDEFLNFAEKYKGDDPRMVSALFRAMQGKESTDLANAGLEVDATADKLAVDNHVRGKVSYFGLDGGKPILSGSGAVTVDQMGVKPEVIQGVAHKPTDLERLLNEEVNEKTDLRIHKPTVTLEQILNEEVKGHPYIENTVATFKASDSTSVVESKVTGAIPEQSVPTKSVSAPDTKQIPETNVPKNAEIVKPEKAPVVVEQYADAPLNKFLKEHKSNPKEFLDSLQSMRGALETEMNSLTRIGEAQKFFDEKSIELYGLQEKYKIALEHNMPLSNADLRQLNKLLSVEDLFKNNGDWKENLDKVGLDKDDNKALQLALSPHPDRDSNPILVNGSHAVRIWNKDKQEELFYYDKRAIFRLGSKGKIILETSSGKEEIDKEEFLRVVNK